MIQAMLWLGLQRRASGLGSLQGAGRGRLEADGGTPSLKPAVSVNKQQCARNAGETCGPPA